MKEFKKIVLLLIPLFIIIACGSDSPESDAESKGIYDEALTTIKVQSSNEKVVVAWEPIEGRPDAKVVVTYTDYNKKRQNKSAVMLAESEIDISDIYPLTSDIEVNITDGVTNSKTRVISITPTLWSLKVASFNIRTDSDTGNNAWSVRKQRVYSIINDMDFDICGIQETTAGQAADMKRDLTRYETYGVGRISGTENEMLQIIYKKDRFTVLEKGCFWLSETPDIPSLGWGANLQRICTWMKLKDKQRQKDFYFYSTHLHHTTDADENRLQSVKLIASRMKEKAGNTPAICVGDFNTKPSTEPISEMKKSYAFAKEKSLVSPQGPEYTYNGFSSTKSDKWLDYIFVSSSIGVRSFSVIDNLVNGLFPSDHFPVASEIILY